jgi:hypothetical protein
MAKMDCGDACGAVAFATLEPALFLMAADTANRRPGPDHVELLRQALGAARASVVATSYALITSADNVRLGSRGIPVAVSIASAKPGQSARRINP